MDIKKMSDECGSMQEFLEITPSDNPDELFSRINDISIYLARSGKMMADAKFLHTQNIQNTYKEMQDEIKGMKSTDVKRLINAECAYTSHLIDWTERINISCVNQGHNLRKQLTFITEEMRNLPK